MILDSSVVLAIVLGEPGFKVFADPGSIYIPEL
jgi:uncharacterized protein with PIN domain